MPEVSNLELLGDELTRRGLHTTLAPQADGQLALDVIQLDSMIRRSERVTWSGESYCWPWGEQIAADVTAAAEKIMKALSWRAHLQKIGLLNP